MDFVKTFLSLTEHTVPYGHEKSITHLLPQGLKCDKKGNYFITIGQSRTLFTCHLDTVSKSVLKIKHVIKHDEGRTYIGTDETTILGGDNKAGVCILMYLIEQQVPGTYYFFVGEEVGAIGSKWALKNDRKFFANFDRAIAYDRKKYGSVITHQNGGRCASKIFANALSEKFIEKGLNFKADDGGVFTDTAVFMGIIPECTNLSAGVFGEHTKAEFVDITYTEAVAKASALIEWENLPTNRKPEEPVRKKKFFQTPEFNTSTSTKRVTTYSPHVLPAPTYQKPPTKEEKKVTLEGARDVAIGRIKNMIYRQEVYKPYVNLNALMFDKFFQSYNLKHAPQINKVITWMEDVHSLSKVSIYERLKPYLKSEFWDLRLSEDSIKERIETLIRNGDIIIKEEKVKNPNS